MSPLFHADLIWAAFIGHPTLPDQERSGVGLINQVTQDATVRRAAQKELSVAGESASLPRLVSAGTDHSSSRPSWTDIGSAVPPPLDNRKPPNPKLSLEPGWSEAKGNAYSGSPTFFRRALTRGSPLRSVNSG